MTIIEIAVIAESFGKAFAERAAGEGLDAESREGLTEIAGILSSAAKHMRASREEFISLKAKRK